MNTYISSIRINRLLFTGIALASLLSMIINTGSVEVFLRYMSISINMIIILGMLYLAYFLPDMQQGQKRQYAGVILVGICIYLIIGNTLPLLHLIFQVWFREVLQSTGLSAGRFILQYGAQFVGVPLLLYSFLRYEIKTVFSASPGPLWAHILILFWVYSGVFYLVYAAM